MRPDPGAEAGAGLGASGAAPLRVSVDVSAVPEEPKGAGRYTLDLVAALARLPGLSLVLWARHGDGGRWEDLLAPSGTGSQVRAEVPGPRPARLAWEQVGLSRALRAGGVDVHHGPHYTMPRWAPVPTVVTIHDLTFFDHPEWHERTKVPVFRHAIATAARRASALVCVSEATRRRLEAHVAPTGREFVVGHGVDLARFTPGEPRAGGDGVWRQRLGVTEPYVLFVGTLEPRKAVPDLVEAFGRLAGDHRALTLVLAGAPGWGARAVADAVAASPARERIVRLGYVADAAVPALLRGAAVVAYPALEEGFGLPALEALACGAPLVTTRGTAMAEVAGDAAVLAEAGAPGSLEKALRAARGAPAAERGRRRREGLARAAARTWEASALGHLAAYRWAVGEGAPVRRRTPVGAPGRR